MNQKIPTPEETELHFKEEMLKQKQDVMMELELTLSTLQANLHSFEIEYYLKIGSKYVYLDRLQADLDLILASKIPEDSTARKRSTESSKKAEQSAKAADAYIGTVDKKSNRFETTPELKSVYRELAKLLHPDLTLDPNEKERRHKLMQMINEAYQAGNLKKLNDILESERNNPENIKGEDIGSTLVRVIRKIAQIEKRIAELDKELRDLRKTDLFILFEMVNKEASKGINQLDKMVIGIDSRIAFLQNQIKRANM